MDNRSVKNDIKPDLLIGYLNGNLSEEQIQEVEKWFYADSANAELLGRLTDAIVFKRGIETMIQVDSDKSYNEFKKRTNRGLKGWLIPQKRWRSISGIAGLLFIIFLSGFISVRLIGNDTHNMVVRTNIGERTQIELPDGSRVWLNACSRISYEFALFSRERKVALEGEAYFEVDKSSGKPFVVSCQGVDVKVLGTKFNVMGNSDEDIVETSLLEGSVRVFTNYAPDKEGVALNPQERIMINKRNGMSEISYMENNSVEWINGTLRFEGNTFEQIARTLEKNYNIDIIFKDDHIAKRKFTCDFSTYDNIYRIMSILKLTEKFDYKIAGRCIEIESK